MNVVRYFTNCIVVFQGGGCKAISYIGAYKKAYQEGVFFSELAGTSAGSVIAALIAAGASPEYLENIVKKIDFSSFKVPCGYNSVILRLLETFFVLKQEKFKFKECLKNFPKVWKACKPYSWNSLNKEHGFFKSEVVEINMEKWSENSRQR